jgi:hypothetical protein
MEWVGLMPRLRGVPVMAMGNRDHQEGQLRADRAGVFAVRIHRRVMLMGSSPVARRI